MRECCGGLGFSTYSRIGVIRNYFDVNQTWEGDNNVLLQQTGKFLLELYRNKMMGKQKKQTQTCEWMVIDSVEEVKCNVKTEKELLNKDALMEMLEYRCNLLTQKSAMSLTAKMQSEDGKKVDPTAAWNDT